MARFGQGTSAASGQALKDLKAMQARAAAKKARDKTEATRVKTVASNQDRQRKGKKAQSTEERLASTRLRGVKDPAARAKVLRAKVGSLNRQAAAAEKTKNFKAAGTFRDVAVTQLKRARAIEKAEALKRRERRPKPAGRK